MSKPQVPKKIPIKGKEKLELKKNESSDEESNYQMPRSPGSKDNEEYFFSNYSHLSDMASKISISNNEDKKEYYYNKLAPKIPPKSVINSINKEENLRKKSHNDDIYEYTYCQVFAGDDKSESIKTSESAKFLNKSKSDEVNEENNYYKRSKILEINKLNNKTSSIDVILDHLIDKNFIPKHDLEVISDYNKFENQLYSNQSNLKCADCQASKPNWISCRFMIILCNQCAYIHNRFGHELNEFYLIESKELFNRKSSDFTKICILKLLFEVGNEKFNLLLEQNSQKQEPIDSIQNDDSKYNNREQMIQEKYLNCKPFLDDYDLNLQLFTNIQGNCVTMTVYNLYLLGNLNTTIINYNNQKSLLDQAIDAKENLQIAYLLINNFKSYSELFNSFDNLLNAYKQLYIGEVSGSYDRKKPNQSVICQLDCIGLNFMKLGFNCKLNSIQMINMVNEKEIEIQHFDENQLKNLYLTFNYPIELVLWQKEIVKKLVCNYLNYDLYLNVNKLMKLNKIFDLIISNNSDIKFAGYLTLVNNTFQQQSEVHNDGDEVNDSDDEQQDDVDDKDDANQINQNCKVFAFICISKYDELIFKRDLIIINIKSLRNVIISNIDLRKMLRLKRNLESLLLNLDMPMNKSFSFKFNTLAHLNEWFCELNRASEFEEFKTLEMQYLNKSNIPLIIEQTLNFMQINNSIIPTQSLNANLDSKHYKFIESLILSLEKNKAFNLFNITIEQNLNIDKNMIGYLIMQQFLKETFLFPKHLFESIIKSGSKLNEIFARFCLNSYNLVFYSTFKFILMNLYIFLSLKRSELDDTEYLKIKKKLVCVYSRLIFHYQTISYDSEELNKLLNYLIDNFIEVFQINKSYLKRQFKIIEKSIQIHKSVNMKIANLNYTQVSASDTDNDGNASSSQIFTNLLITVFVFHSNNEQSFQLNVNKNYKIKQLIDQTKHKYAFIESKYWCLSEVLDLNETNKANIYLERVLPVNATLVDILSKWNKLFYLCFKVNEIEYNLREIKPNDLLTTFDKCNCIHLLNTFQNFNFNNKLKSCFLSLQKSVISIYKNLKQKNDDNDGGDDSSDSFNIDKPLIQMNIENCIVYRGFISSAKAVTSNRKSISENQQILDTDHCLTIYHILDNQLYLVSFLNQLDCVKWYYNLFKIRYYPDTWSVYKSDTFPNVKPNVPNSKRSSIIATNETNKKIFDIFKKK